ncbi:MAG: hypothetical protein H7263_16795 [Candidatus Sericytochromatia bacterium]|nr:hypothetical protein [Candidatus Sericytochromatia bacterium]
MNLNKKLSFSLATFSVLSILASCSSGNLPSTASINGSSDFSKSAISSNVRVVSDNISKEHLFIDVGNGVKTGASITVNVNLGDGFKTKSADGTPAKTVTANLKSIEFLLVTSTTGTAPSGTISAGNIITSVPVDTTTAGPHVATFTNVPDNATGQSYYVLASAFSSTIATGQTSTTNITNAGATASSGLGKAYVSTTGGDTVTTANNGSVKVSGFLLSPSGSTTDLGIPLTLLDGVGATVTGATTVTDGGYTGTIGTSAT